MQIEQILREEETIDKKKTDDLLEQMRLNADSQEVIQDNEIAPAISSAPANATPIPTNLEIESK